VRRRRRKAYGKLGGGGRAGRAVVGEQERERRRLQLERCLLSQAGAWELSCRRLETAISEGGLGQSRGGMLQLPPQSFLFSSLFAGRYLGQFDFLMLELLFKKLLLHLLQFPVSILEIS